MSVVAVAAAAGLLVARRAPASSLLQRVRAAMAAAPAVQVTENFRFTGYATITAALESGALSRSGGRFTQVVAHGKRVVGVFSVDHYGPEAYLVGTSGGLVVAGLRPTRARAEAGRWLMLPVESPAAALLERETRPAGALAAFPSAGPVRILGHAHVGRHAVTVLALGTKGDETVLDIPEAGPALPLRALVDERRGAEGLQVAIAFTWGRASAPKPPPAAAVAAAAGWFAPLGSGS